MKRSTFYKCDKCGTIAIKVVDGGGEMCCCKEPMRVLDPNTTDAAQEKHVPSVSVKNGILHAQVGSVAHPMEEDHYIQWIYVVTEEGVVARCLKPGQAPEATIDLEGQTPIAVYEYCNKHGLWKAEV